MSAINEWLFGREEEKGGVYYLLSPSTPLTIAPFLRYTRTAGIGPFDHGNERLEAIAIE
ncbi:hypothetical protein ACTXT7_006099 [Hymenolepis weldensis]